MCYYDRQGGENVWNTFNSSATNILGIKKKTTILKSNKRSTSKPIRKEYLQQSYIAVVKTQ